MHYTARNVYEFISKQTSDPIIERRTCHASSTPFPIYQSDANFYQKISPSNTQDSSPTKQRIPFPILCPEERSRQREAWRNECRLYRNTSILSGKKILSMYAPHIKVVSNDEWFGDAWSGLDYGRDIDFTQDFQSQFSQLLQDVPKMALSAIRVEEGPYNNNASDIRRCYLCQNGNSSQDCMYGRGIRYCKNIVDCLEMVHCDNCYACADCEGCYELFFSQRCRDCKHSSHLTDCTNCDHCRNCQGLNNASYHINNQAVSPDIYKQKIQHVHGTTPPPLQSIPLQAMPNKMTTQSRGTFLSQTKNAVFVSDSFNVENAKYCYRASESQHVMDIGHFGRGLARSYASTIIGLGASRIHFCIDCWENVDNLRYCHSVCNGSHDCFGCVGLKNASYCIFNKQYSKYDYEIMVAKIITHMQATGEWGRYISPSLSPFGYNETLAQELFPLDRESALQRGFNRQDNDIPINVPSNITTINAKDLPTDIEQVDDNILSQAIICEVSGKPFRIIKPELAFYRKYHLPLPRKHPDLRHADRIAQRPGKTLYLRTCDQSGEEILSVYPPDAPFKVYAEEAYRQEVFG